MLSEEWPLIIFTILAQLAVGIWLIAVTLRTSIAKKTNNETAAQLTGTAILLVGPIMAVSLLISLFHLGTPMRAYGSIANLRSSWLSREIIFSGLFLFFWLVAYLNYRKANTNNTLGWITSILGLLAVFSMASIYHASIIPAWATINTYIAFLTTTLVLGASATFMLVGLSAKNSPLNQSVVKLFWKISFGVLVAIITQLIFAITNIVGLTSGNKAAQVTAQLLQGTYSIPLILHGLLLLVGGFILAAVLYKHSKNESPSLQLNVLYSTFLIMLAGELVGRIVFYASAVALTIG